MFVFVFFFYGSGDHRDLHRVDRRQRQMCIRDRIHDEGSSCGRGAHAIGAVEFGQRRGQPLGGVAVAVSYTHLRAHETVLDLVCRLLLEKKNKR